jgi:DNA-directed RNA polymerase specialized sigma24 family protein
MPKRLLENLSIKDTAVILGIPEGSVKTRLHRGRLILRDLLSPGITGRWRTESSNGVDCKRG